MIAIAAMAMNRVIGHQGGIPWHLSGDLRFFKRTTMGHVVVMGRKTFESIGKPLPGRENVVLSRREVSVPGVRWAKNPEEVVKPDDGREVFVIGGAEIYKHLLPKCREILLTVVKQEPAGDVYFPPFEKDFELAGVIEETGDYEIRRYVRREVGRAEAHPSDSEGHASACPTLDPERKRPIHLPLLAAHNRAAVVFVRACTKDRRPVLANEQAHEAILEAWRDAESWRVGRYVLMPDHVHLFCGPAEFDFPLLGNWMRYLEGDGDAASRSESGIALAAKPLGPATAERRELFGEMGVCAGEFGAGRAGGKCGGLAVSGRLNELRW